MRRTSTSAINAVTASGGPAIVVTSGEPAGVGPDLCLAVAQKPWPAKLLFLGDPLLFRERAAETGSSVSIEVTDELIAHQAGVLRVSPVTLGAPVEAGRLDTANAAYVMRMLDIACDGCLSGRFQAMVTAPVQKSIISDSGLAFTGHTEYLAQRTHSALPVMLLVAGKLRVALATTHLPLSQVPQALSIPQLVNLLSVLDEGLRSRFALARPRIVVCGLNPHAGEGGHLGREEIDIIEPAIKQARAQDLVIRGPVPADTAFTPRALTDADAVLAMYHDQGLPVLKHAGFGSAINVTLGLPIIRTSVDHGTALDLAGTGRADAGSLIAALQLAVDCAST